MPSYGYNQVQSVPLNQGAIFNTVNGCRRGTIWHEDETPLAIIRGVPRCQCNSSAKFKITAIANIALPEGAAVAPIAVALLVDGVVRPTSRAISTPAAALDYDNVVASDIIEIPKGCCFRVAFGNVSASEETGYVPAQLINMQNLNITIDQVQ